jgi:hypothetical protein
MKTQDMIILVLAAIALWMLMGKRASFADVMNAPAAAANAVASAAAPAVKSAVAEAPGAASSAAASAGNLELKIQKIFSNMAAGVKQALGGSKSSFSTCPCGM